MGYLIYDTTKEDRQQNVSDSLALTMLGELGDPSKEAMKLAEAFINGELEAEEIREIIMRKYTES